ncbi:MAG: PAS domain S-box protein [Verrucomicrobia bacterium]|nr:PAS domain S-box protein [Verrucomicrobiota bacterium]
MRVANTKQGTGWSTLPEGVRYRLISKYTRDPMLLLDATGRIVEANKAAVDFYGYSLKALLKLHIDDLQPADAPESAERHIREAAPNGIFFETLHKCKSGTLLPVEISSRAVSIAKHKIIFCVVRDITERKQAQQAFSESQRRLRTLMDTLPIAVSIAEDPECRVITTNPAGCKMFAIQPGENISASAPDPERPEYRYYCQGRELKPDELPMQLAIKENRTVENMEIEARISGGRSWTALVSAAPLCGPDGKVSGGVAVKRDITQRKLAEDALRMSEVRYRSLFENSAEAIFTVNCEGRFLSANPAAEALSGYSSEELQTMTFAQMCVPEYLEATMASFIASLQTQQPGIETAMHNKQGRRIELFVTGVIVTTSEEAPALFCIARDITMYKRIQLEQRLTLALFEIFNSSDSTRSLIQAVTAFLLQNSGCDAIGIRLREGDDFPYYETRGFSPEFIQSENRLCTRDSSGQIHRNAQGEVVLKCLCGSILCNRCSFTEHLSPNGSFWNTNLPAFVKSLSPAELGLLSGQCWSQGYQSILLIPLGRDNHRIGLLQMNSFKKDFFSPEDVAFWELLAHKLSSTIAEHQAEEALWKAQTQLETHAEQLEQIIAERTAKLWEQTADRERLQDELIKISEREKQRIAQELHDGLCQHLAGTALLGSLLQRSLASRNDPATEQAKEICDLLSTALEEARNLSHGLHPVKNKEDGLMEALSGLAQTVTKLFHVQCTFHCDDDVLLQSQKAATHLFRIAQEAVNNAIKHGQARKVLITLKNDSGEVSLSIRDNGIGIPPEIPESRGMGMEIMNHRAEVIGAWLTIRRTGKRGTAVTCTLPSHPLSLAEAGE